MLYQSNENDQNRTVNKNVTLGGIFEIPTHLSQNDSPGTKNIFHNDGTPIH
jgi:hypothetical protein